MAARHTPDGQPSTSDNAVPLQRFKGVGGTGGGKPAARREKGADEALVETDQQDQKAPQSLRTTLPNLARPSQEAGAPK